MSNTPEQDKGEDMRREESAFQDIKGANLDGEKGGQPHLYSVRQADDVSWTLEEETKLRKKIDWHMVPLLVITFALTYYDKTVISMAIIYTMKKDLHLVGNQYQNSSLIFYVGYLIGSFPLSYIAQKYHVGRSIAVMCLLWGVTVLATIWCRNYHDLMIQRAFLGFIEAGVAPTFIAICGSWYTRREQVLRVAFFYASTPYTSLWGPPLTYALGLIHGPPFGNSSWKVMFLFAGLLTIAWTVVIFLFFPSEPAKASWLSERERSVASARVRLYNASGVNHTIKFSQIKECLLDYHFWLLCICGFAVTVTNGTTSSFAFIVIKGFGFNNLQSLLFKMPWGFLAGTNMCVGAWLAGRYPNIRLYIYMLGCIPVLIGSALLWAAPSTKNPRTLGLVGYYFLTTFGMAYAQVMAMCGANMGGYTKKVTASAGLFVVYSVANIVALLSFQEKQAPSYSGGFTCVVVCAATGFVTAGFLRFALARRNAARDAADNHEIDESLGDDLTDKQNPNFRYAL